MTETDQTDRQQLIQAKLGVPLADYVKSKRNRRKRESWRRIALLIRDETGIDVTGQTLRGWFG